MGILDDIKTTAGNESRNGYFPDKDSNYKVRVELCKTTTDGNAFIVEMEVLESDNPEVEVGEFKDWFRSTVAQPGKAWQRDRAAKEILTFLTAASGYDPDKAVEREAFFNLHAHGGKLMDAAIKSNALDGALLNVRTSVKKTKPSPTKPEGGTFTNLLWSPCKDALKSAPAAPAAAPPPPAADPYAGMPRDPSGTLAWNGTAWIVMATGLAA